MKRILGLVQVFTGNGRGKTSAAVGTAARAAGYGLKICVVFFMKCEHARGEYQSLSSLGVKFKIFGRRALLGFKDITQADKDLASQAFGEAWSAAVGGSYDLVVLDEILTASAWGLINTHSVIDIMACKDPKTELILTGRYADDRIIGEADLVTELRDIKHYFNQGVVAREGIDY